MKTHLSLKSTNIKVGPIPVSTSSAETCPDACPFKSAGCYAKSGPMIFHWRAVTEAKRGHDWFAFLDAIKALPAGQLWRHNQAGDLPGIGDKLDTHKLAQLVEANAGKRGFTYTHKPLRTTQERGAVFLANVAGFTINLSGNNPAHADTLAELKIAPVVSVVPVGTPPVSYTPAGRKIVVCPAQQREGVTCATCKLCSNASRSVIVGFLPHGNGSKAVNRTASLN